MLSLFVFVTFLNQSKEKIQQFIDEVVAGIGRYLDEVKVKKKVGELGSIDELRELPGYINARTKRPPKGFYKSTEIWRTIWNVERSIMKQTNEFAYVMKETGEPLTFKPFTSGTDKGVKMTDAFGGGIKLSSEQRILFKGSTVTHNHPLSSSLSYKDMLIFIGFELKEIRAIGNNGYLFSLKLKEGIEMTTEIKTRIFANFSEKYEVFLRLEGLDPNNQRILNTKIDTIQGFKEKTLLDEIEKYTDYYFDPNYIKNTENLLQ